jgi:hypothetical protein
MEAEGFEVVSERRYMRLKLGAPLSMHMVELTLANGRKLVGGSVHGLGRARAAAQAAVRVVINESKAAAQPAPQEA